MTLFFNIWSIVKNFSSIVAILKTIIDIVGSDQVVKVLESIKNALRKETVVPESVPKTEEERIRIRRRGERRLALELLGMTENEYETVCQLMDIPNRDDESIV